MQSAVDKRAWALLGLLAITAIFSGCKPELMGRRNSHHSSDPRIEIALQEGDMECLPAGDEIIERAWFSPNTWHPKPKHSPINLQLFYTEQGDENRRYLSRAHHSSDEMNILWPKSKQDGEPVTISFESRLGSLNFNGQLGKADSSFFNNEVRSYGTVTIDINKDATARIENAFGAMPSLKDTLSLIIRNTDPQKIIAYADCSVEFDIAQAAKLAEYNLTTDDINKLIESGYRFNADNVIKLAQYHVSVEYALTWINAGYNLSADKLVYAKQRHLSAAMATEWKNAGHNVDLETVYWIKQRHLKPEVSKQWQKAGYQLDLEQLYWVKQRHLDPNMAADWKKAGYDVDIKQLYWIKQRHLNPQNAVEWKQADFNLDFEQLYWIKQRHLKPQNATQWKRAGYDLSLEQLYWIKQRHLSAAEAGMWKKAGYNLSLDDLYKLKQYHIGSNYGKAFANPDYEPLTVDELIKFKQSNISAETVNKLRKQK